jgi:hypothetical protein
MKIFYLVASVLIFISPGCNTIRSYLAQAKPYTVVGEAPIPMYHETRTGNIFYITSDAVNKDEFAQTAVLAALELHEANKKLDVIEIDLIPDKHLINRGVSYASVCYAIDKKGIAEFSGTDPNENIKFEWLVRSATEPLTKKELMIVNLWYGNMKNFPAKQLFSNLSFDYDGLITFVAETMHIPVSEVQLPVINLTEYKSLPFIK